METKTEKKPTLQENEKIIDAKLDQLFFLTQLQKEAAEKQNRELKRGKEIIADVKGRTEKQTNDVADLGERAEVESYRSRSWCSIS